MAGRVDRLRTGPEPGDEALQAVVEQAAGALGRGQVPARPLEEALAGVLDAGRLRPGQRVAADEALVAAERADLGYDGGLASWGVLGPLLGSGAYLAMIALLGLALATLMRSGVAASGQANTTGRPSASRTSP